MRLLDKIIFIPTEKELLKVFDVKAQTYEQDFMAGIYKDTPVIVTGIGKANAGITAALFFSKYSAAKVALVGICGAYRQSGLKVGDTVSVTYDYFVDECVYNGENIVTLAEKDMPPAPQNRAEFERVDFLAAAVSNTVSFIAAEDKISELYRIKTNAYIENMEGAAFGIGAARFGAKPYHIRTISNFCGNLENQNWDINKAAANLKKVIDIFLK